MEQTGSFRFAGFGLLRGQNWCYLLRNTHVIIGRKPSAQSSQWIVDVDLGDSRYIARQHAIIIYNFKRQYFQIKCLTRKGRIKVDGRAYRFQDGGVPLKHRSVITIYKTSFLLVLPV